MSANLKNEHIINEWVSASNEDFETMLIMFENKKFNWSLFLGHLVIEKLLKAYYLKINNEYPPYIHNLLKLAYLSGIDITEDLKLKFTTISAFNLNARYDDYKKSFQKKCNLDYTSLWIDIIKELRSWIKELIKK